MKQCICLFIGIYLVVGNLNAQTIDDSFKMAFTEKAIATIKFAPRIFSPRIGFEKVLNSHSTLGAELRGYLLWIPQGAKIDVNYRYYFNEATLGGYIQPKVSFGYFDFSRYDDVSFGVCAGGGFVAGGQWNIGSNNAVIDLFGGFQIIPPYFIRLDQGYNTQLTNSAIYYVFMSIPIELGIRFGFMKTTKIPTDKSNSPDFY